MIKVIWQIKATKPAECQKEATSTSIVIIVNTLTRKHWLWEKGLKMNKSGIHAIYYRNHCVWLLYFCSAHHSNGLSHLFSKAVTNETVNTRRAGIFVGFVSWYFLGSKNRIRVSVQWWHDVLCNWARALSLRIKSQLGYFMLELPKRADFTTPGLSATTDHLVVDGYCK